MTAAPGLIRGATRVSRLASLIDTAPTILDWLGRASPTGYQGDSLLRREVMRLLKYGYVSPA